MENTGNDANDACGDVVGNDPTGVEGVESLRPPGRLDFFNVSSDAVGVTDPHARTKNAGEVESTETEAAQTSEKQVDAEDLGQIQRGLAGAGVLPNFQVPIGPVPDGGKEHEATEHDMSGCYALEAPKTWVNAGFSGDAPATPAAGHAEACHEGHHKHPLTPHGVQDRVRGIKDGEFIESHRAGPASHQSGVHDVHRQEATRVVDDDRMNPVPGQSHWFEGVKRDRSSAEIAKFRRS